MADTNTEGMAKVESQFYKDTQHVGSSSRMFRKVTCNVADANDVQRLMQVADEGQHDDSSSPTSPANILINCAGITRDGWITRLRETDWDDVVDVNLKGTFLTCQAFLRGNNVKDSSSPEQPNPLLFRESIVNVGSVVSELGNLGQANYAASKGGVLGLTRALAKEVAIMPVGSVLEPKRTTSIRVNAVVPGFIDTPMSNAVPEQVLNQILPKIALRRMGTAEELADAILFLVSPRSSYITGEAIRVGGMISL